MQNCKGIRAHLLPDAFPRHSAEEERANFLRCHPHWLPRRRWQQHNLDKMSTARHGKKRARDGGDSTRSARRATGTPGSVAKKAKCRRHGRNSAGRKSRLPTTSRYCKHHRTLTVPVQENSWSFAPPAVSCDQPPLPRLCVEGVPSPHLPTYHEADSFRSISLSSRYLSGSQTDFALSETVSR
jgi:hypothetical protein